LAEGAAADEFFSRGWRLFAHDQAIARWVEAALPLARATLADPQFSRWWRCDGTWFAGVNALANNDHGAVPGGPPLAGAAIKFIRTRLAPSGLAWDRAQISACFPGYPRHGAEESEAAFRYRRDRDAAHVDGLARSAGRRRHVSEPHAFILGLPLTDCGASPLVVWEGSHVVMAEALRAALTSHAPADWSGCDVTEAYVAARERVFATCKRVAIKARPGEAYVVHRLALHGVSPWQEGIAAGADGRMIAYFRPPLSSVVDWLA